MERIVNMKKWGLRVFGIVMILLLAFSGSVLAENESDSQSDWLGVSDLLGITTSQATGIAYRTHVQNVGWESNWTSNGYRSGTEGQNLRLEGIEIKLTGDVPEGAKIEYRTHVQNVGWEKYWSNNGNAAGTQGMSMRLEGIQIRLVNMPDYSIEYRTHIENVGWETKWAKDGEKSGTEARGLRLEGIQIRISKEAADLTDYNKVLATARKALSADYTVYSWANLQTVIKNNVVTTKSNQADVDAATNAIETAYNALESLIASRVYTKAGTYGSSGSQEIVNQDVIVKADGVILQNMYITGNLIISEEVGLGTVTLNNITVRGETYIRGGGTNSIHINGGSYKRITLQETISGQVRIVAKNAAGLDIVIAEAASGDELILEGDFDQVSVNAPNLKLLTRSGTTIAEMTVARAGAGSQISLDNTSRLERLIFNGKADVKGQGVIGEAQVNADSVTYEKAPEKQTVGKSVKIPPIAPPVLVSGITISAADSATSLIKGKTLQLSAAVTPINVTNKNVTWSVTNGTGSATISSTGLLTGVANGTVTVNATAKDGSGKIGTLNLTVLDAAAGTIATSASITAGTTNPSFRITLTNDTFTSIANTIGYWASVMGTSGLTVTSINRDSDTQVTINTTGTATVGSLTFKANAAALSKNLASNTVTISVTPVLVTSINVTGDKSATSFLRGSNLQMSATVLPSNAANKNVTWSIAGGTATASITKNGILTATKAGTVMVKATAADASAVSGTISITVLEPSGGVISSSSKISYGDVDPKIVVVLTADTFSQSAYSDALWAIDFGESGLKINGVTRDSDSQVTIKTTGTAAIGTISIEAKPGAMTKNVATNQLALAVTPITVTAATLSGTPIVGNTLTASTSPAAATVTYEWQRAESATGTFMPISGETMKDYKLVSGDEGKYIRVWVTGNGNYMGTAPSTAFACVNPAIIAPTSAAFDRESQKDITITLTANGKTLEKISDGTKDLQKDSDYAVAENSYTIKKEYLATKTGETVTLTFNMNSGTNPVIAIALSGVLPGNTTVSPANRNFDKSTPVDLSFTLTLNGRTLTAVKNGAETLQVGADKDYIQSGDVITIKAAYLSNKSGIQTLNFEMNGGSPPIATITIYDDLTKPILNNVTVGPVTVGATIAATSNEAGFIYLVPTITAATKAAVEAAGGAANGAKVAATANNAVSLSTGGFTAGTYQVYAIDNAGNVSNGSNAITVNAAPEQISFNSLTANGQAGTTTTTALTLTLAKDVNLVKNDVALTGATLDSVIDNDNGTYTLAISNITVANAESVTVALSKAGYTFNPASQTVSINKAP